jgi:hypothetical protein
LLNGEPEADLIDVIFPADTPKPVQIGQKLESPSAHPSDNSAQSPFGIE